MWTVIRFCLGDGDGYPRALELLRHAGFRAHRTPDAPVACPALPASVVADLLQDPAVVTRAVFEALLEARLRPVAVTGAQVGPRVRPRVPLASR